LERVGAVPLPSRSRDLPLFRQNDWGWGGWPPLIPAAESALRLHPCYDRSVEEWSEIVRSLSRHADAAADDFQLLMKKAEVAKTSTKQVRAVYSAHIAEHGC
jgi:hypothetical protein